MTLPAIADSNHDIHKEQKSKPKTQEIVLEQDQRDVGRYTVYITHDAIKMVNNKVGAVLIAKAPLWEVHFFRPSEKVIWSGSMDRLSPATLVNPMKTSITTHVLPTVVATSHLERPKDKKVQLIYKEGVGSLQGLHYVEYTAFNVNSKFLFRAADQFPIAPKGAEVLCRMYRSPLVDQIPLYVRSNRIVQKNAYANDESIRKKSPFNVVEIYNKPYDIRTGPQEYVVTKSWKEVPFNSKDFSVPTDYKHVAEFVNVTYSRDMKSRFATVIDDVGFAGPSTSDDHKSHK